MLPRANAVPSLDRVPISNAEVSHGETSLFRASSSLPGPLTGIEVSQPQSHWQSSPTSFANDPITIFANLQSHDGSYALDEQLVSLLQRQKSTLSLDALKAVIPESLRTLKNSDMVWATVLAAAYMMIALADKRSLWDCLWDKAQEFVCDEASIASYEFNNLVQKASALLN